MYQDEKKTLPSEVNSFKIKSCYFENEKGEENTQGKGQCNLFIPEHLWKVRTLNSALFDSV